MRSSRRTIRGRSSCQPGRGTWAREGAGVSGARRARARSRATLSWWISWSRRLSRLGCTRAWWLAAIDDRVRAIVGVACFTRYTELLAHGNLRKHGIYYFVPGVLRHFDTEAIYALIAPRPHLELSGDQDGGAPADGIEVLERKLGAVYRLYGKPENFRSVIYKNTGH